MSSIENIINGSHGIFVLAIVSLFIFVALYQVKKGVWSFSAKGLSIGIQEKTTTIIRDQWELIDSSVEGFLAQLLLEHNDLDVTLTKYIGSKVSDILQKAVVLNSMTRDSSYISIKQTMVYNAILKRARNKYIYSDDFKKDCFEFVSNLIDSLIRVREERLK